MVITKKVLFLIPVVVTLTVTAYLLSSRNKNEAPRRITVTPTTSPNISTQQIPGLDVRDYPQWGEKRFVFNGIVSNNPYQNDNYWYIPVEVNSIAMTAILGKSDRLMGANLEALNTHKSARVSEVVKKIKVGQEIAFNSTYEVDTKTAEIALSDRGCDENCMSQYKENLSFVPNNLDLFNAFQSKSSYQNLSFFPNSVTFTEY